MALLDSEVARIKVELGYNVHSSSSPAYDALFETAIQPYIEGGATTTSATAIAAEAGGALRTLALADATGFSAGDRIVVDVDGHQETVTARSVVDSDLTAFLALDHSGTYPVTVEGPETLIREILKAIRDTKAKLGEAHGSGALKRVDEVEFYDARGVTMFGVLGQNLAWWREQLAAALGVQSLWAQQRAAAQTLSVY